MTATATLAATTIVSSGATSSSATKASRADGIADPGDRSSTPKQFDHQLNAARQQQGLDKEAVSDTKPDSAKVDGKSEQPAADAKVKEKPPSDQTASALVGVMLAFVGPPLKPVGPPPAAASGKSGAANTETKGAVTAFGAKTPMLPQSGVSNIVTGAEAQSKTTGLPQVLTDVVLPRKDTGPESSANTTPAIATQAATGPAMPPTVHLLQLPSPVASQAFGHELAQQVTWLGGQDLKQARIRLHPEDLGQLDVKVNVTHGRVDVIFSAQHPAAVAAVQQSLPQLGHLLAQHGLNLGHAEVGQHSHGDRSTRQGGSRGAFSMDADEASVTVSSSSPIAAGLLDAFA